ncbi:hypothetical protein Hanom_Chr08g00721911 [Helianthus anomalus]
MDKPGKMVRSTDQSRFLVAPGRADSFRLVLSYHVLKDLLVVNSGAGFKGRGGAPDPPNFSVSSVIYVRFV